MKKIKLKLLALFLAGTFALTGILPATTAHAAETYVVVLDPGHGGSDPGTSRTWNGVTLTESTLNYTISTYTKAALEEKYNNLEVYITKSSASENPSIADRVNLALSKNADVLVSQHVNSTTESTTTATGVLAIVPQVDSTHPYNKDAALLSQALGRKILNNLVALGYNDRGFTTMLSQDGTTYPDGSLADYYGIVKRCRENNLPGIIIEHGFINNESDAAKLADDGFLKQIGAADAQGIVDYLIENLGYDPNAGTDPGGGTDTPDNDYPFTDLESGYYYIDAVEWAVENGITTGKTDTTFAPNEVCTRGQVVTFLWRAFGSPDPTNTDTPFTDLLEGYYYVDAVQWAVENAFTTGKTDTTFAPDNVCTRAEVVTFLWRAMGSPEPVSSTTTFTDLQEGYYYLDAVQWAVENGITTGTSDTTFSPDKECTRAQVVTFLYRCFTDAE